MNHTRATNETPVLLMKLMVLLAAQRSIFGQERVYRRAMALVLAEVFAFGRHTVTQLLLTLGLADEDWSAWYRLFSQRRFDEAQAAKVQLQAILPSVPEDQVFVTGFDGFQVPRHSQKMHGTSWLKALNTAHFKPGIHRAQRFLEGSWLVPQDHGYSRAIPLRCLAAFPAKAIGSTSDGLKEWQAGVVFVQWLRSTLDDLGRRKQCILALADGGFDTLGMWQDLPERVALLVRTPRNRALFELPGDYAGRGRPPSYGAKAPTPAEWLSDRQAFKQREVLVRGQLRPMRYRIEGPFLRDGLPQTPLFLIVIGGGKRPPGSRRQRYEPCFYLVSALQVNGTWCLPLPEQDLLTWLWQRWELEICHREMKSAFGLGEKQCWNPQATVRSVQWSAWVYSLLVLAGYQAWGLLQGPPPPGRWRKGPCRWSFSTLWRGYRTALWQQPDFRATWSPSRSYWPEKEVAMTALNNAIIGAARL
jgi:hypothetical protein